jgi:hypothetical protein
MLGVAFVARTHAATFTDPGGELSSREFAKMEERREAKRKGPSQELLVYDRAQGACLGRVTNVSASGFMLTTVEPYPPKAEFRCRIPLPSHVLLTEELLFDARAVWSRQVGESQEYQTGFELIHITPDELENIELVLRELTVTGYWS